MGIEGNNYEKRPLIVHHSTLVHMNGAAGRPRRWRLIGTNRPYLTATLRTFKTIKGGLSTFTNNTHTLKSTNAFRKLVQFFFL